VCTVSTLLNQYYSARSEIDCCVGQIDLMKYLVDCNGINVIATTLMKLSPVSCDATMTTSDLCILFFIS
jgi:hypothetical protein